jgi:electron transfer flavoprotein alpha/beta subunit
MKELTGPPIAVLLRRLQPRPGAPSDEADVLGRCEGGALSTALDAGTHLEAPVVAIAVGPARREDRVLAMALRAGCAKAVRVDDADLGDVDYLGLASVLAAAVKKLGARVVVCGDRSGDEASGAIGPAIAELLEWAHVTSVRRADVDGDALVVTRAGDAVLQRLRVSLPAVLCVAAPPTSGPAEAAPEARRGEGEREARALPGAATRRSAEADEDDDEEEAPKKKPRVRARTPVPTIDELDLADLGIDPRAIAPRRSSAGRLRQVRARGAPTLSTSPSDLVARLREDRLLGKDSS